VQEVLESPSSDVSHAAMSMMKEMEKGFDLFHCGSAIRKSAIHDELLGRISTDPPGAGSVSRGCTFFG
jgi:hypothetical protein